MNIPYVDFILNNKNTVWDWYPFISHLWIHCTDSKCTYLMPRKYLYNIKFWCYNIFSSWSHIHLQSKVQFSNDDFLQKHLFSEQTLEQEHLTSSLYPCHTSSSLDHVGCHWPSSVTSQLSQLSQYWSRFRTLTPHMTCLTCVSGSLSSCLSFFVKSCFRASLTSVTWIVEL